MILTSWWIHRTFKTIFRPI